MIFWWDVHVIRSFFFLSSGHIEVVKLLASHGAEVACKDKKSYTPLHAAASSGMISVVKYLLDLGVDVSSTHSCTVITLQTQRDLFLLPWKKRNRATPQQHILMGFLYVLDLKSLETVLVIVHNRYMTTCCSSRCSDQWAQRVRQHTPPCGLLQWAGRGGERAHRLRGQRQPGEREGLRTSSFYRRLSPRGALSGASSVQRGRRQH